MNYPAILAFCYVAALLFNSQIPEKYQTIFFIFSTLVFIGMCYYTPIIKTKLHPPPILPDPLPSKLPACCDNNVLLLLHDDCVFEVLELCNKKLYHTQYAVTTVYSLMGGVGSHTHCIKKRPATPLQTKAYLAHQVEALTQLT